MALSRAQRLEHLPHYYFSADTTAGCPIDMPQGNDATGFGTPDAPFRSLGRALALAKRGAVVLVFDACDTWETTDAGATGDNESVAFQLCANDEFCITPTDWTACDDPDDVCVALIGSDPGGLRRATFDIAMTDTDPPGFYSINAPNGGALGWFHVENIDHTGPWPANCANVTDLFTTSSPARISALNLSAEMCAAAPGANEVWTSHNSQLLPDKFVGINVDCFFMDSADGGAPCFWNIGHSTVALIGGVSVFTQVNTVGGIQIDFRLTTNTAGDYSYGYVNSRRTIFNNGADTTSSRGGYMPQSDDTLGENNRVRMFVTRSAVLNGAFGGVGSGNFVQLNIGAAAMKNIEFEGFRNASINNDSFLQGQSFIAQTAEVYWKETCSLHHKGANGTDRIFNGGNNHCDGITIDLTDFLVDTADATVGMWEGNNSATIAEFCTTDPATQGCNGGQPFPSCDVVDLASGDPFVSGGSQAQICMTADCQGACSVASVTEAFGNGLFIPAYLGGARIEAITHYSHGLVGP